MINWLEKFMDRRGLKRCVNYCRNINDRGNGRSFISEFNNFERSGLSFKCVSGMDKDKGLILDWIKDCQSDEKRILSNVSVFNEGFDCPSLDCLVINDKKESFINIVQNLGRIVRNFGGSGVLESKKMSYFIIPLYLDKEEMEMEDDPAVQKLLRSEYKKLIKIVDNLRKIDSIIKEDCVLDCVEFECDFQSQEQLKEFAKKISLRGDEKWYQEMKELE